MNDIDWGAVATVLAAILLLLGTYLTVRSARQKHRIDHAELRYDQMQEDRDADRKKIAALEARLDRLARHIQIRDDYIGQLRMHIATNQPPPPPPYPHEIVSPA